MSNGSLGALDAERPVDGAGPPLPPPLAPPEDPSTGLDGESFANEFEATLTELMDALDELKVSEVSPENLAAKDEAPHENQRLTGQLTLKDMPAAVWIPRLPKRPVAEDPHGVVRPVANPHHKSAKHSVDAIPSDSADAVEVVEATGDQKDPHQIFF